MTTQEIRQILAEVSVLQKQGDEELREMRRETERLRREAERQRLKTERQRRKTEKQLSELGKQLGGLGRKWGGFAEGLALPSMQRILYDHFGATAVMGRFQVRRDGRYFEPDVLAYRNGEQPAAFIVEVKSSLREEGIQQLLQRLRELPDFVPEYADRDLYGILAAVDAPEALRRRVLDHGLYFARIHDETFALDVPENFVPRSFRPSEEA